MPIPVEMPKMSDTMEEGVLVSWLAEEGDAVSAGDIIAQVETDKATMDLEVYDDGVLLKKVIAEGDSVPIGALIAVLGKEGEDPGPVLEKYRSGGEPSGDGAPVQPEKQEEETPAASEAVEASAAESDAAPSAPVAESGGDGAPSRRKASPLARKLARENEIDLAVLEGSGPEGRIVKRDVEAFLRDKPSGRPAEPARPTTTAPAREGAAYESMRISQMRKAIARRLSQSKFTAPHFYLTVDVDMRQAVDLRSRLNSLAEESGEDVRISFNDLITKACAVALRSHPMVNASYLEQEGEIRLHNRTDIAVAVAIDDGLITPVVRGADQKGLAQIAAETRDLATRARDKKLEPSEYENSTFTTSNLGMFGIEEFTAIINPPNACILAIGAIRDIVEVDDGEFRPGKRMKLTLSCDHRVVDGATGAQFMATLREILEEPLRLLL